MSEKITKKVGVYYNSDSLATVRVWAPSRKSVRLKVKEQQGLQDLTKDKFGYWELETKDLKPGMYYKILLDGELERPDPASLSQPEGVHSWSQAVDHSAFAWTDQSWSAPPLSQLIIYELHVGTFTADGTFAGVMDKLDHLLQLGVNAIELMPIAQFPGERNWGYDGVFPFAPQNSYGGVGKLKQMVDKCHQKGIAVILDVVYNHLGPEGNYLGDFGPYFTDKYHTPWGHSLNYDDQYSDHVRNFFLQNAIMWLEDYHFDGLRLDAVHAIIDTGPVHFLKELRLRVDELEEKTGKKYFLIAESDLNDIRILEDYDNGGYGLQAQWADDFHHAVHTLATGEDMGYYRDFGRTDQLAKSIKQAFVYDGQYSENRKKTVGTQPQGMPPEKFVVCIQNHDQVGNRMLGDRLSKLVSFEMLKLAAGILLSAPYVPMLFMGEEFAEDQPFLYFVNHGSPDLIEAVREGRRKEFEAFEWGGDVPDPQSPDTFLNSKLQWNYTDDKQKSIMLSYYKALIKARKEGLFASLAIDPKIDYREEDHFLTASSGEGQQAVFACLNFGSKAQSVSFPEGRHAWNKVIASPDLRWAGPKDMEQALEPGQEVTVPPSSFSFYITNQSSDYNEQ